MKYTLHDDVKNFHDQDFIKRWAEALKTSKQEKGTMMNSSGGKCCLGVAASLEGVPDDALLAQGFPSTLSDPSVAPISNALQMMKAAYTWLDAEYKFSNLNDASYGLTHAQISELLLKGEVEV